MLLSHHRFLRPSANGQRPSQQRGINKPSLPSPNVGFVPYSPLGCGFLTGAIKSPDDFEEGDFRKSNPRFKGENFNKNLRIVEKLKQLAGQKGYTPSQLALAWVLAKGEDLVPIPGT